LELAADRLDPSRSAMAAYIGDMPDDVMAAHRANGSRRWLSLAIAAGPDSAELSVRFRELGADYVLTHPDQLLTLWPEA
jgi:phosphoglycolate phosphatase-like HAD superfamily hydrolase